MVFPLRFAATPVPPPTSDSRQGFANRSAYANHLAHLVLSEMQTQLSELAAAYQAFGGDLARLYAQAPISAAAQRVLVGASFEAPGAATMIFTKHTRVFRGDLKNCARGDLWVLVPPGQEPLILRSVWRGVTPKGKLLCTAVNHAAQAWLQSQASPGEKMASVTAFALSGFSSELMQLDTLQAWAEGDAACEDARGLAELVGIGAAGPAAAPADVPLSGLPRELGEAPELQPLNAEQREVLRRVGLWALGGVQFERSRSRPVLVRGVFGSGKSRTLAACVVLLDRLLTARKDPRRIMLVCQTNVAVDAVLHTLLQQHGWDNFARLGSFKSVDPALLYRTVSLMSTRQAAAKELTEALERLPQQVRASLQAAVEGGVLPPRVVVWRRRRLVAATTAALENAEHLGADSLCCPIVLVDEATQLTEPAVFGGLQRSAARCALVIGDPRQLPPRAEHGPMRRTMLERLWEEDPRCVRIEMATQYRCHPDIAALGSSLFYGNSLRSGVTAEERASVLGPGVPPVLVLLSTGAEVRAGRSYKHEAEAQACVAWLQRALGRSRADPASVGVICLYRPQADTCAQLVAGAGLQAVKVATVDAFQGAERDIMVLSCGRSAAAAQQQDGFGACPRRLNVALSRGRRHLIVIGSEAFLSPHPVLSHVLRAARQMGAVHPL